MEPIEGPTQPAPPQANLRSSAASEEQVARWHTLLARASFPPQVAEVMRPFLASAENVPPSASWVMAFLEAERELSPEALALCRSWREPSLRRAIAWGLVARREGRPEALLDDLLAEPDPGVRAAAVLALAVSPRAARVREILPAERLSAAERELLDGSHAAGEPVWNEISGAWVEARFEAAKEYGLVDGQPYRVILQERLLGDAPFLLAVVLCAVPEKLPPWAQPHLAAAIEPALPADLLADLLARFGGEELFPFKGKLAREWNPALEAVLLDPLSSGAAVAAVAALGKRLDGAAWSAAARRAAGDTAMAENVRRGFAELGERAALASLCLLGRCRDNALLGLLNQLSHSSTAIGDALRLARLACGDGTVLDGLRQEIEMGDPARQEELLRMAVQVGACAARRDVFEALTPRLAPEIQPVAALLLPWGETARRANLIATLLSRPARAVWWVAVARVLSAGPRLPARVLARYPLEGHPGFNRVIQAWMVRHSRPEAVSTLHAAIAHLETDAALLAALELEELAGIEKYREMLFTFLAQSADPRVRARIGWILGRTLGAGVRTHFKQRDPSSDPAFAAALLGIASRREPGREKESRR